MMSEVRVNLVVTHPLKAHHFQQQRFESRNREHSSGKPILDKRTDTIEAI